MWDLMRSHDGSPTGDPVLLVTPVVWIVWDTDSISFIQSPMRHYILGNHPDEEEEIEPTPEDPCLAFTQPT